MFILTGKTSFFLENRTDIEHYKENVFILTQTGKTVFFFFLENWTDITRRMCLY